jgi:hypothetical protein
MKYMPNFKVKKKLSMEDKYLAQGKRLSVMLVRWSPGHGDNAFDW